MGQLEGKVAFITGAARGQGRSHALRLAREGADIVACDICQQMDTVGYLLASPGDLEETARAVEDIGRRVVARKADVRDPDAMELVVQAGLSAFGRLDVVVANAGIAAQAVDEADPAAVFADTIAVNLTGVRNTVQSAAQAMIDQGHGGSIIITSSTQGLSGAGGTGGGGADGYVASKHGVVGLMRSWANWLAPHRIRVNTLHPTGVRTTMIDNDVMRKFLDENPSVVGALSNLLPVDALEPEDVSNAVAWLAGDESRYVTGVTLPIDAGFLVK